jgi:four helix bundle protein
LLNLNHKNLDTWKKSLDLVKEVYKICDKLPSDEKYNLISQLKRCAISVSSNIAEGYARKSLIETKRFLDIARSSLVELDTQIEICVELGFLILEEIKIFEDNLNHIFAMISNLIKSIRT